MEIDPSNPDRILFTTGYGIWASTNASAVDSGPPVHWVFENRGLEETVALGLISPPQGAHLISAMGDQDGYVHDDLTAPPATNFPEPPRFGNSEDIDFAELAPQTIVRIGRGGSAEIKGAFSEDGGRSWQAFATPPVPDAAAGTVAVSADGKTIVWTPQDATAHLTRDRGKTWQAVQGLDGAPRIVADRHNPQRFYALDAAAGRLFISTDGGATFELRPVALSGTEGVRGGFGGGERDGASLQAVPGRDGDLWLAQRKGGLFHSTDGGESFQQPSEAVEEVWSMGFGKAPPGSDYPALFIGGQVSGVDGIFRSDDAGKTWQRINDDRHQFGWINHVTGDPRIFGRVYFGTGGRGIIYGEPVDAESE